MDREARWASPWGRRVEHDGETHTHTHTHTHFNEEESAKFKMPREM